MNLPFELSHENKRDLMAYLKLLSPLLFLFIIFLKFHTFVVQAVEANLAINSGIILASLYGVVLILIRLRDAQLDFRIIERFGHEANNGTKMKDLLEQPWLNTRYVRHYLKHIANTGGTLASQIDQSAIESELHALQEEYNNRLELPQFIVGFMIAMGLLGTFIGLLETLTGISGMLDGMGAPGTDVQEQFGKLVVELRKPLAGMGIAFSASMFGLITSLMLAVMMINVRRYVGRVISLARNVMHDLIVIVSTASHQAPVQSGKADPLSSISNTSLAGRFDLLTRKIESVLEAFEVSIGSTQRMVDLMSFGPRMKEISERSLDEMKAFSGKMSDQQRMLQLLIEVSTDNVKSTNALLEVQQLTKDTSDETLQALKNLAGSDIFFSQRRDQEFRDRLLSEMKGLNNLQTEQKKLAQSMIDVGNNNVRGVDAMVQVQKEGRVELYTLVNRMIEGIQKVEEVDIGGARHLYEIKERLIKLCNNFNLVDLIASSISGQTVLLETLVEEARITRGVEPSENGPLPEDDLQIV